MTAVFGGRGGPVVAARARERWIACRLWAAARVTLTMRPAAAKGSR